MWGIVCWVAELNALNKNIKYFISSSETGTHNLSRLHSHACGARPRLAFNFIISSSFSLYIIIYLIFYLVTNNKDGVNYEVAMQIIRHKAGWVK